MNLRQRILDRRQALQTKRADLVQQHAANLAQVDAQLAALASLAQGWPNIPTDQVLTLLADAGMTVEVR